MKKLLVALTLLTQASAFAEVIEPTHFKCGNPSHSTPLEVQFAGPRYADWVTIDLHGHIKPFLNEEEQVLKTHTESMRMALSSANCKVQNGDLLLECSYDSSGNQTAWDVSSFGFTYDKKNDNSTDVITVQRHIRVNKMDLKVIKVGDMATMQLALNLNLPNKENTEIKINKNLATMNHDWFMCKFVNKQN